MKKAEKLALARELRFEPRKKTALTPEIDMNRTDTTPTPREYEVTFSDPGDGKARNTESAEDVASRLEALASRLRYEPDFEISGAIVVDAAGSCRKISFISIRHDSPAQPKAARHRKRGNS